MKEKLSTSYKKFFALFLCPLLLFWGFLGCKKNVTPPDYRELSFCAEIVLITSTSQLRATAEVSAPTFDGTLRDVTLSFHEPRALEGLVLSRKNGTCSLHFIGLLVESFPAEHLLRTIDLLLCEGKISILGECELDENRYLSAELQNDKEGESYELYLEPETGFPKELRTDTETLRIESFTSRSP